MADETKYVWIVNSLFVDCPRAEQYVLIEKMPSGVRVNSRGTLVIVRPASGRRFFYSLDELTEFFNTHVEARIAGHLRAIEICCDAIKAGIGVHSVPSPLLSAPKPGWLD